MSNLNIALTDAVELFLAREAVYRSNLEQPDWKLNPSKAPARYFGLGVNDSMGLEHMHSLLEQFQDGYGMSPLAVGQVGINRLFAGPRTTMAFRTKMGTVMVRYNEDSSLTYLAPESFYICQSLKGLFVNEGECTLEHLTRLFTIVDSYHDA